MAPDDRVEFPSIDSVNNLTDPKALRALAHPIRLALIGLLRTQGPLTATRAAELLGESSASTSFHLRQLSKYGLAEEAGGGQGRERRGGQPRDGRGNPARGDQPRDGQSRGDQPRGSQSRDGRRAAAAPPANSAMADALRRAGLTSDDGAGDRNQRRRPR